MSNSKKLDQHELSVNDNIHPKSAIIQESKIKIQKLGQLFQYSSVNDNVKTDLDRF